MSQANAHSVLLSHKRHLNQAPAFKAQRRAGSNARLQANRLPLLFSLDASLAGTRSHTRTHRRTGTRTLLFPWLAVARPHSLSVRQLVCSGAARSQAARLSARACGRRDDRAHLRSAARRHAQLVSRTHRTERVHARAARTQLVARERSRVHFRWLGSQEQVAAPTRDWPADKVHLLHTPA